MNSNRSSIYSHRDLDVFKKAYTASLEIHKLSLDLPKIEQYALADQMRRASKSICANIVEGFGKQRNSVPEFRRFLSIAIGSSDEMQLWCEYCHDLGYWPQKRSKDYVEKYIIISKMLSGLLKAWITKS